MARHFGGELYAGLHPKVVTRENQISPLYCFYDDELLGVLQRLFHKSLRLQVQLAYLPRDLLLLD